MTRMFLSLLVGASLIGFGLWVPKNSARFVNADKKVTATVEEVTPGGIDKHVPYPTTLLLRYEYGGAIYRKSVNAVDKHWQGLKGGDAVKLLLGDKPDQIAPEAAFRETKNVKNFSLFCLVVGSALVLLAFFSLRGR